MTRRAVWCVLPLVLLAACAAESDPVDLAPASGPPSFRVDAARGHADQFEGGELRNRPAGSQQEQGAAVYILGVLQRDGYIVRLDGVPVRNLVNSTNVIARAPEHETPEVIVAAPYDSPPGRSGTGEALGLLLELARAVNVPAPERSVWFVALGAEHAQEPEDRLGSRRLAQLLVDQGADPFVVRLGAVEEGGPARVAGPDAERLATGASDIARGDAPGEPDVFQDAGFATAIVSGGMEPAGEALFRFLQDPGD